MSSLLSSFNMSRKQPWHLPSRKSYTVLSNRSRVWLWSGVGAFILLFLLASGHAIRSHHDAPPPTTPPPPPAPVERPPIVRPDYLEPLSGDDQGHTEGRYAYVTWLSNTAESDAREPGADLYFTATRLLVWQLLHDPQTKTTTGVDVVVMVGPRVSQSHRDRLTKDGAIVRPVELVHGKNDSWIVPEHARWADVMGKLRAWQMSEYDKVVMLDGDMVLQSPLDGVFADPGASVLRTKPVDATDVESPRKDDEPDLPDDYLLSSYLEIGGPGHAWPPVDADHGKPGYFNAGFFMLRPDQKMFDYFVALLDLENRFSPLYPEQNLFNYAFRWDGPMPWREHSHIWNIRFTTEDDLRGGVVSMHEKFWATRSGGQKLKDFLCSKRWQMEGYYQAMEELQGSSNNSTMN